MSYYTAFQDSILVEATYGASTITTAATTTYLVGAISQKAIHPNPKYTALWAPVAIGQREVAAGGVSKVTPVLNGMWTFVMQNGWPLWFVMGASSTVDADPIFTHTLTPAGLPSFTLHHERTGSGTDWAIQYTGCMVGNLKLLWDDREPFLIAVLDWVAQDAADPNLDGTNAMLSTPPVLPPAATTGPYSSLVTATFDGNAINALTDFELSINPGLTALMANWTDSGVDMSHVPLKYIENLRRDYKLTLTYHPADDDLWDESIAIDNTKDMVFKFQKSANDYIELTLSDIQALWYETTTPVTSRGEGLSERIEIEFRALSIEVKDGIAGGLYGE